MISCVGCGRETIQDMWGNWCDNCGGVVIGPPPRLFFRHVATLDGAGGRYSVVYDLSSESYGVAWPKKSTMVKCTHCGQLTPGDNVRFGLLQLDEINPQYYSTRGTLDAVVALIQPVARGDSDELPTLSVAPSCTEEERKILLT